MNKLASFLSIGLLASSLTAQACFNSNIGTGLGIGQDSVSALQPIGFAFPFDGNTYTDFAVSDHGLLWLSNAGVPAPPIGGALLYTPQSVDLNANGPVIAPFWSDTIPGAIGDVFVNSSATECVITWQDMIYFGGTDTYTFQLTLSASGGIKMYYSEDVTNNSTFGGVSDNAIVGVGPGNGAAIPASLDFSMSPVGTDPTMFEEFLAPETFDMKGFGFEMIPLNPGYAVLTLGCAQVSTYGAGCINSFSSFYEEFADSAVASTALTGQSLSLTNTGAGYVGIWTGAPSYVPPVAGTPLTLTDEDEVIFTPTAPLATPFGPFSNLTVHANGIVGFGATPIAFPNTDSWVPTAEAFLANGGVFSWHDYNAAEGGQILAEEIGGVLFLTWEQVESYPGGVANPNNMQFQLNLASGDIVITWDQIDTDTSSAFGSGHLIGVTAPGASLDPGSTSLATSGPFVTGPDAPGLALDASLPRIGQNWDITTTNIDSASPISITFFGTAQGPGLDLTVIGLDAPGCSVWINTVVGDLTGINAGGTSTVTIPIPNNQSLAGATLTGQSICLTLQNNANLLTSNGVEGLLGN